MNINGNAQSPNFGMAFRKPKCVALTHLTESIKGSKTKQRGLEQFVNEQKKLKHYDIEYKKVDGFDSPRAIIINNETNEAVSFYSLPEHLTGLDEYDKLRYPGRKLIAKLFNPKKLLPKSLYLAGEEAKKLEQAKISQINAGNAIDKMF